MKNTSEKNKLIVYWTRRDFRLHDNPALHEAVKLSRAENIPFLPLYILEDYMLEANPLFQFGYPSRYFISKALPEYLHKFSKSMVLRGKAASLLKKLSKSFDIQIFVNEDVHPDFYKQIEKLKSAGVKINVLTDALTIDRDTLTGTGNMYSVFTPFKNNVWSSFMNSKTFPNVHGLNDVHKGDEEKVKFCSNDYLENIKTAIKARFGEKSCIETSDVKYENLIKIFSSERIIKVGKHKIDLSKHTSLPDLSMWYFDEDTALDIFDRYLKSGNMSEYKQNRDSLEKDVSEELIKGIKLYGKTSKMSVALAWGLVSPRTLVQKIKKHFDHDFANPLSPDSDLGAVTFLSELIWREFYKYLYFHNPELSDTEFQAKFRGKIDWVEDKVALERFIAWIEGRTGYPIVDASMKQLEKTGWMHNRSRMIVASILTKNLGVDWRWGQEYFRAVLIDLDEASNNGGWQWGASVGADPKPIRIFNPTLQANNYDASHAYRDKWLNDRSSDAGFFKQETVPIVEHKKARDEALERYKLGGIKPRDY